MSFSLVLAIFCILLVVAIFSFCSSMEGATTFAKVGVVAELLVAV